MSDTVVTRAVAEDTAEKFFDAMTSGDRDRVSDLFAADIAVRHTGDRAEQDKRQALAVIDWFLSATRTRDYRITSRRFFDGGFVQQHTLAGATESGVDYALAVAIIVEVDTRGHISRIDEYLNPADLAPLMPSPAKKVEQ